MSIDDNKKKRRGLGKGLSLLIPQGELSSSATDSDEPNREFTYLSIDQITPASNQPRKTFDPDALAELSASIVESGLIQPLVVRTVEDHYELIAGERRWRACQLAGVSQVPVIIRELADDVAFTIALVENLQREDLSILEQAMAFQRLINDFGFTQAQVAESVGKSRSAVANTLRLLKLPEKILDYIENDQLTPGHARTLVTLSEDEATELAEQVVLHGYSVRETEELARDYQEPRKTLGDEDTVVAEEEKTTSPTRTTPEGRRESPPDSPQIRYVTERLEQALGTRVSIKDKGGKGNLVVHYDNLEILQDILERILGECGEGWE